MSAPEGAWRDGAPAPRRFEGLLDFAGFCVLRLTPLVLAATLTDGLGTGLVFLASPGAVGFESNQYAVALYPRLGALAPLALAPVEFLAFWLMAVILAACMRLLWSGWRLPALAVGAGPFFAVSSWLVWGGLMYYAAWPAVVIGSIALAAFSSITEAPPRGGWA